jgi:hypothetical protein
LLSNLLKNNLILSVIIILLAALGGFFIVLSRSPFTLPPNAAGAVYSSMNAYSENRVMFLLLSLFSLCGGAFLFNYVVNNNETLSKPSFFPAFIYLLISFEGFTSFEFHPAFMSNLLIVLGVMRMMKSYRVENAKAMFFDGAFMISSATLFYFPSITLIPLVFICLLILRPFLWREWVISLMGIAAPHLLAASIMYLMGTLSRYYNEGMFSGFSLTSLQLEFGSQYFVLVCITFLFLLLVFNRLSGGSSRKIRQQKNINILSFWFLLGIGGIFYEVPYRTSIPLLCVPPVAGLLGEWLGNIRRSTLSDFALLLLMSAFALSVMQIHGVF